MKSRSLLSYILQQELSPQGTRHNTASVPIAYYRAGSDAVEVEEERLLLDELADEDKALFAGWENGGDDEPF